MSFAKTIAKAAISGLVESFASAAGTHIADRLLQKEEVPEPEREDDAEPQSTSDKA